MRTAKEIQDILIEKWLHKRTIDGVEIIEPEEVAKKYNISVWEVDLSEISEDISGYIHYDTESKSFKIRVSSKDHYNRKRFTLAHELGHFFLHLEILKSQWTYVDTKQSMMFRGSEYSPYEQEANMFAAEYLMPEEKVRELFKKYGVIEILAGFFKVSNLAMAFRIDNLNLR